MWVCEHVCMHTGGAYIFYVNPNHWRAVACWCACSNSYLDCDYDCDGINYDYSCSHVLSVLLHHVCRLIVSLSGGVDYQWLCIWLWLGLRQIVSLPDCLCICRWLCLRLVVNLPVTVLRMVMYVPATHWLCLRLVMYVPVSIRCPIWWLWWIPFDCNCVCDCDFDWMCIYLWLCYWLIVHLTMIVSGNCCAIVLVILLL